MKPIENPIGKLLIVGGFIASLNLGHAQTTTRIVPSAPANDTNLMSVLAQARALAAEEPVPAQSIPVTATGPSAGLPAGTYWSLQNLLPPLPFDLFPELPVYTINPTNGIYLIDDRSVDYPALQAQQTEQAQVETIGPPMPGDGGDGGTNFYTPNGSSYAVDYGTNLWIANFALSQGNAVGMVSNTTADISYEIQYKNDLTSTQWLSTGFFILGSEVTNWTAMSVPGVSLTNNAFFRIRSWADDGSGLPIWWQEQYFGTTGVDPNAQDLAGDGWTIWQDFEAGYDPTVFHTPPTPQGLTATYNADNTATVSWLPSPGPVTGYTVQRDYVTYDTGHHYQTFNPLAGSVSLHDATLFNSPQDVATRGLTVYVSYQIQAHYAGGDSPWSSEVLLEPPPTKDISLIPGPQNSAYLAARNLPTGTTALRLTRLDNWMESNIGDSPSNAVSFDIPLSSATNGLYPIPAAASASPVDNYGSINYSWFVQPINVNGQGTAAETWLDWLPPYSSAVTGNSIDWLMPPYFDGRVQLKQNLIFLLRAATVNYPFDYNGYTLTSDGGCVYAYSITNPAGYAYSGFNNPFCGINGYVNNGFDVFSPFENNYFYQNFLYSPTNLSGYHPPFYPEYNVNANLGHIMTGVAGSYDDSGVFYAGFGVVTPNYQLITPPTVGGTPIAAGLAPAQTQWLATYPLDSPEMYWNGQEMVSYGYLEEIGVTPSVDADGNQWETMASNARNLFGLPFLSVQIAYGNSDNTAVETTTLSAGNQVENIDGYFYPQTAQPQLQTVEYDFWAYSPQPGNTNFVPSQTSDVLMAGVGTSVMVNAYAKQAVLNGYVGAYGYLGQYFDTAYAMNTNGVVTTNTIGMLSSYGQFFATEPGPVALVTMPDIDTDERGTCMVYCVSLQLDKNHDGNMDLSFNGPDATSPSSPYVFWCDNNFDRSTLDADDNTNYEDDVQIASNPGTTVAEPDCNYSNVLANGYSYRAIPTKRDLEDFTRLWVCGVTSNLLAALPSGSTVTLNWGDVGSPNSGNPTIDLFTAADADGGIGYLTNETIAAEQTNIFQCPYIGRLGPGQSIQLNTIQFANNWAGDHFIWCGVSNGIGGLNLTIADGNGNVLAQTTAYIQIVDIKQMYERWTVGDNPANAPTNAPTLVTDGLAAGVPGFQYTTPTDTTTPYILFVHGWNMEPWEKDRFAETAFKRLYWQGYQGRFGEFRWPTYWGFTGDFSQLFNNQQEKDNFDNSEYFAWLSGTGLLNKLNDLNSQYPSHVYMLAHSMGNVVAGEALRLAGNNQMVNTYVASQAAVTAHTYDTNIANYSFTVTTDVGQFNFGPHTPNIYGNWFAGNNGGGAGKVVSFYNANDYALSQLHWQLDQLFKPDQVVATPSTLWTYGYSGNANDPAPWNHFYKTNLLASATLVNFDIVNSLTNRYEVMAFAAQAYTTALGATPGVTNLASLNLTTIWPTPDPLGNNYASHFFHSAEFRGDTVWEWGYWNTLLFSSQFGFNISNP